MRAGYQIVDVGHGRPKVLASFEYRSEALDCLLQLLSEKGAGWDLIIEPVQLPN